MHKFMRTVGFSNCQNKTDLNRILRRLSKDAVTTCCLEESDGSTLCELRAQTAPGMGVVIVGRLNRRGTFSREYYFPYVLGSDITSLEECSILRHAERETYAGMLDEYRVGISLIFYMENSIEYRLRQQKNLPVGSNGTLLCGMASEGCILLPVMKTKKQDEDSRRASTKRGRLLEAARQGDEDALETLTIEDIDLYSMVSRRLADEDVYSIIDTCFMPSGVECDQYSIIGNITNIQQFSNCYTGDEICRLQLECNNMTFSVIINHKDLLGEPAVGRRFKGQIWMQGTVQFDTGAKPCG